MVHVVLNSLQQRVLAGSRLDDDKKCSKTLRMFCMSDDGTFAEAHRLPKKKERISPAHTARGAAKVWPPRRRCRDRPLDAPPQMAPFARSVAYHNLRCLFANGRDKDDIAAGKVFACSESLA